jgi:hypothetical protein
MCLNDTKALWRIGVDLTLAQIESVVGRWRWKVEYCTKKQIWPAAEDMFERQDYPGCLDPVLTKSHLTWARRFSYDEMDIKMLEPELFRSVVGNSFTP